jgi:hypothetical protein
MSHVKVRFNPDHKGSGFIWTTLVDGKSKLAKNFEFNGKVYGESNDVTLGYWAACDGDVTWENDCLYVKGYE